MKKLIVATVGSVAIMSGSAFAGCQEGSHTAAESDTSMVASAEETDSELLAKLKAREEAKQLEKLIETLPAFN